MDVCIKYLGKIPGELVEITHWEFGAWASNYEPNVRGIRITDSDIAREFGNRTLYAAQCNISQHNDTLAHPARIDDKAGTNGSL